MRRPISSIKLEDYGISSVLSPNALDTSERIIQYCKQMGFIANDVTDIRSLIDANDELQLEFRDLGHFDASIERVGEAKFLITINSKHPPRRQRFSMAHEYAHYQLHRHHLDNLSGGEQIMHRSAERDPREYQANRLAGEILMPSEDFERQFEMTGASAEQLSEIFDISLQAARMRANELGLVLNE